VGLVYYFLRVADNLSLALISAIFGFAVILVLRHIMRKSGMEVYQNRIKGSRSNSLSPEFKVVATISSGIIFAGIVLLIIRIFADWLPIYVQVPLAILCGVIGAIIGNTIRKTLQKQ
jgi:uncharacterized membrane protein YeaQ/YmgE (transglycosylase-associated protein family)